MNFPGEDRIVFDPDISRVLNEMRLPNAISTIIRLLNYYKLANDRALRYQLVE